MSEKGAVIHGDVFVAAAQTHEMSRVIAQGQRVVVQVAEQEEKAPKGNTCLHHDCQKPDTEVCFNRRCGRPGAGE